MEFITFLVENYKTTTKDFNLFIRVILALVLAFIIFAIISAMANLVVSSI